MVLGLEWRLLWHSPDQPHRTCCRDTRSSAAGFSEQPGLVPRLSATAVSFMTPSSPRFRRPVWYVIFLFPAVLPEEVQMRKQPCFPGCLAAGQPCVHYPANWWWWRLSGLGACVLPWAPPPRLPRPVAKRASGCRHQEPLRRRLHQPVVLRPATTFTTPPESLRLV